MLPMNLIVMSTIKIIRTIFRTPLELFLIRADVDLTNNIFFDRF